MPPAFSDDEHGERPGLEPVDHGGAAAERVGAVEELGGDAQPARRASSSWPIATYCDTSVESPASVIAATRSSNASSLPSGLERAVLAQVVRGWLQICFSAVST